MNPMWALAGFVGVVAGAIGWSRLHAVTQSLTDNSAPNISTTASVTPTSEPATTQANATCSSCTMSLPTGIYWFWSALPITATHTVETVIYVVNKKNETRTTTQTNADLDLTDFTKSDELNAEGTHTLKVPNDGAGNTVDM